MGRAGDRALCGGSVDSVTANADARHGAWMKAGIAVVGAWWIAAIALMAAPAALADGGQILLQRAAGAYTVTVFATPEPVSTGDADLTALVQESASQQAILDASVTLTLQPEGGVPVALVLHRSGSQLLYAGSFHFQEAGAWHLNATVRRGTEQAEAQGEFTVTQSHARGVVLWICLAIPAFADWTLRVASEGEVSHKPGARWTTDARLYGSTTFS